MFCQDNQELLISENVKLIYTLVDPIYTLLGDKKKVFCLVDDKNKIKQPQKCTPNLNSF